MENDVYKNATITYLSQEKLDKCFKRKNKNGIKSIRIINPNPEKEFAEYLLTQLVNTIEI